MTWLLIWFIQLTGPENQVIQINPSQIVVMRELNKPGHFAQGTHCVLNTLDGKIVSVYESCAGVKQMIEESQK